jgi:hypothetical protein
MTSVFLGVFFAMLEFQLRAYTLNHSTSPFFAKGVFRDKISQTVCLGCLQTGIFLISAF